MDTLDRIFNSADIQEPEIEIKTNDFYRFKLLIYIGHQPPRLKTSRLGFPETG